MTGHRPAVFLDRDGTILEERHYLADPDAIELIPGALEALCVLREAGYALVVVTNQSGIDRALYTEEDYRAVAARLEGMLRDAGVAPDATRYCPHHPTVSGVCTCRKPGTGMHEDAARALDLDPARSWFVGDKRSDVLPALSLGGRGILVRTGYGGEHEGRVPGDVAVVDDLSAAARHILAVGAEPRR